MLEVDLPVALFEQQVAELAESGRVVTLDAALEILHDTAPPPVDPVVLTFDDGTADLAEVALPVLDKYRVPATLYLATDFVERQCHYDDGGVPLSWTGVEELAASGVWTIGSHTHTHVLLDRTDEKTAADELDRSIDLIASHVGSAPKHFAYPKALLGSPDAQRAVRERFVSAALAGTHSNRYGATDVHQLSRSPIQVGDGMRWFRAKADGGMRVEDNLRRLLNRGRYAGATT
jgi:peptidoglycan/xylan/chitin deacetylase (PgdA/CDA1 family)